MSFTLPMPIASPGGHVDFNNNVVSGTALTGGYQGWQLWPGGVRYAITQATVDPVTMQNVDSLFCYKTNNKYDLYFAAGQGEFEKGETVTLKGPSYDPENPNREWIMMTGQKSQTSITFNLKATTDAGDNSSNQGRATQYVITLTVEALGTIVFQTKANI